MPLEFQNMRLVFDAGLDQEIDEAVFGPETMTGVRNAVFRHRGAVEKRLPVSGSLDQTVVDSTGAGFQAEQSSTLLPSGQALAIQGGATVRVHDEGAVRMRFAQPQHQANIERIDTHYDPFIFTTLDSTVVDGLVLTVAIGEDVLLLRIVEVSTGQELISRALPDVDADGDDYGMLVRIERGNDNTAVIFLMSDGTLGFDYLRFTRTVVDMTDRSNIVIGTPFVIVGTFPTIEPQIEPLSYNFDTTRDDAGNIYCVYYLDPAAGDWVLDKLDPTGAFENSVIVAFSLGVFIGPPAVYAAHGIADVFVILQESDEGTPNTVNPRMFRFNRSLVQFVTVLTIPAKPQPSQEQDGSGTWHAVSMVRCQGTTTPRIFVAFDALASQIVFWEIEYDLSTATSRFGAGGRMMCKLHFQVSGMTPSGDALYFPILNVQKPRNYALGTLNIADDEELEAQPGILMVALYLTTDTITIEPYPYNGMVPFGRFDVDDAASDNQMRLLPTPVPMLESEVGTAEISRWHIPYLIRGTESDRSAIFGAPARFPLFEIGSASVVVDYDVESMPLPRAELGDAVYVGGACVHSFSSGEYIREASFHWRPILRPSSTIAIPDGGLAALAPGVYQYAVVAERYDANGDLIRSQKSRTVTVTVGADEAVQVAGLVPLYITGLSEATQDDIVLRRYVSCVIKYYRSEASGTNLLLLDEQVIGARRNTFGWPGFNITDRTPDDELKLPIIYTQGQLDRANDPPPAAYDITEWRNRAVIVNAQDRDELWFSAVKGNTASSDRLGLEFSATRVLRVAAGAGDIEALASLDEKLVVFKPDSIYIILGEGPNVDGTGGVFSQPVERSSQTGCINKLSVLTTEVGIFFQARGGIYLLSRGMEVGFVGHSVTDIIPGTLGGSVLVKRAVVLQELKEVRFLLNDAAQTLLIYHYRFQRWSTATLFDIANRTADSFFIRDIAAYRGRFVALVNDIEAELNTVYQETDGTSRDGYTLGGTYAGTPYQMELETSTFKFANLTGFQRIKNVRFLINRVEGCDIEVAHTYGDDSVNVTTHKFLDADIDSTDTQARVLRVKIGRQKARTLRFILRDVEAGGSGPSSTKAFQAVQMSLEVGIKRGGFRIGVANKR